MHLMVTGNAGYIGSHLMPRLVQDGHRIRAKIDKRGGMDIRYIGVRSLFEVDAIIHLAAHCKINECIKDPCLAFFNNVRGTYEIFEFCRTNRIQKIVFTSSSRVLNAERNVYVASKLYGEELCKAYSECYGIDYVIIRPSTVYGPGEDLSNRIVSKFICAALNDEDLVIYGDENKTLDFTYIDDFIDGFMLAMPQSNCEFNIAGGVGIRVVDVANFIIQEVGSGRVILQPPEISQPQRVEVDITEIRRLGWDPRVDIWTGLKKTIESYRTNQTTS